MSTLATTPQPRPQGTGPAVLQSVLDDVRLYFASDPLREQLETDLAARIAQGLTTYGEPLRAYNGRDAAVDAYQELLDAVLYLRQWQLEHPEEWTNLYERALALCRALCGWIARRPA